LAVNNGSTLYYRARISIKETAFLDPFDTFIDVRFIHTEEKSNRGAVEQQHASVIKINLAFAVVFDEKQAFFAFVIFHYLRIVIDNLYQFINYAMIRQ
jgi:hypothetical protein